MANPRLKHRVETTLSSGQLKSSKQRGGGGGGKKTKGKKLGLGKSGFEEVKKGQPIPHIKRKRGEGNVKGRGEKVQNLQESASNVENSKLQTTTTN